MSEREFEEFVKRYRPALVRSGRGFTGNRDDAEDLCQEVLLAAWENRATIRQPASYCRVAVRHRAWNFLARARLTLSYEDHFTGEECAQVAQSPESLVIGNAEFFEIQALVKRCRLTMKQRRRMCLHYLDGYTHQEIAVQDGVHPTAVTDSIRSALVALRRVKGERGKTRCR